MQRGYFVPVSFYLVYPSEKHIHDSSDVEVSCKGGYVQGRGILIPGSYNLDHAKSRPYMHSMCSMPPIPPCSTWLQYRRGNCLAPYRIACIASDATLGVTHPQHTRCSRENYGRALFVLTIQSDPWSSLPPCEVTLCCWLPPPHLMVCE